MPNRETDPPSAVPSRARRTACRRPGVAGLGPASMRLAWLGVVAGLLPAVAGAAILPDVPSSVDPTRSYLIYLHGRIVEGSDRRPTHPRFGVYEYDAVLAAFSEAGFEVIAEQRPAGVAVARYATKVAGQVRALLAGGVPPSQVAVVGFSKGGVIAVEAAAELAEREVRFVILAGCNEAMGEREDLHVRGRFLSLLERSDDVASSCRVLVKEDPGPERETSAGVVEKILDPSAEASRPRLVMEELEISTGAAHGAFYRPRPEWLDPVLSWLAKPR